MHSSPQHAAAFERELTALIPAMRAFARTFTGRDIAYADDLAQQALESAWRSRNRFAAGTNLRAWVFTILRNQFYSDRRRAWRSAQLDQGAAERNLYAADNQEDVLRLQDVQQALTRLSDEHREALLLVAAGGLSYDEVASITGVCVGTVKSRVSRARSSLQAILEAEPPVTTHRLSSRGSQISTAWISAH